MMWNNVIERQCDRLKAVESAMRNVHISEANELRITSDILTNRNDAADFVAANVPSQLKDFIYIFKVEPAIDIDLLVHYYPTIREELHRDYLYLSNLNKVHSSNCLFVGSRRNNLRNITMQHLGFGAGRTFSMKLRCWYNELYDADIKLQWHEVKGDDIKTSLTLLELGVWESMQPVFGGSPTWIS